MKKKIDRFTLDHGTPEKRIAEWTEIKRIAKTFDNEKDLNTWYRSLVNDARWKKLGEVEAFCDWKIADISGYWGI